MANYFSDHFSATVGATAIDDPRIKAAPGIDHSTLRYKRGTVTVAAGVTDDEQARFFSMKSSDRLIQLFFSTPSLTGTTMTADCGVYATDEGALIDLDTFCAAATAPLDDLTVAVVRTDLYILAALEDEDRGKPLWEVVEEALGSPGTYTEDPHENWDLVVTMNTETAVTVGAELILEAVYTAGGN